MNKLALPLTSLLLAFGASALAQETAPAPISTDGVPVRYLGVLDPLTGKFQRPGPRGSVASTVYSNTAPSGLFFGAMADGRTVVDEGRLPSVSSQGVVGTQNSYSLVTLQLSYVTDATDATLGGTPLEMEFKLYESFAACGDLASTDAPLLTLTLPSLPGSTTGMLEGFTFDVDLQGLGVCMRADGDGAYSDGLSDRFGWSMGFTETGDATALGPLMAGDPAVVPEGDSTVFQNSAAPTGTGLGTADVFLGIAPDGTPGCFDFGGYGPNSMPVDMDPFASFYLSVGADLSAGECFGCGLGDDRFEDNDDAASAAAIDYGSYGSLILEDGEEDFFSVVVPSGTAVSIEAFFLDADLDIDLELLSTTGALLDDSDSTTDDEAVSYRNCTAADETVILRVLEFGTGCAGYSLLIAEGDPGPADDALEDNDTCDMGVPLPQGVTQDLVVRPTCGNGTLEDSDFYLYTLAPGDSLKVSILFTDAITDIDLVFYDVTAGCPGVPVAFAVTMTDNEYLEYANPTMAPMDMAIRVDYFSGSAGIYQLLTEVNGGQIGDVICLGRPNSVGSGARVSVTGSVLAADDDVVLDVSGLPVTPSSFGYFLVSQDTFSLMPANTQGTLCIASLEIGRFAGDVLDSGGTGTVSFAVPTTAIPLATATGITINAAVPGDTWNFQYWYRDVDGMMMLTSNFSDAVSVNFQ